MPYISQDKRDNLDPIIEQLRGALAKIELDSDSNNTEGNINYIFTKLLIDIYGDHTNTSYKNINDVMGLLSSVSHEYYRKVAAPYENQKEFENGAVIGEQLVFPGVESAK